MPVRYETYDGTEPLLAADPALLEAAGGAAGIARLAAIFYERVAHNSVLRPLFPRAMQRAGASRDHLATRLAQHLTELLGGPAVYTERRGHARMYARHRPFRITTSAADEWVREMAGAMAEIRMQPGARDALLALFQEAAHDLVNGVEELPAGSDPRAAARRKSPLRSHHR